MLCPRLRSAGLPQRMPAGGWLCVAGIGPERAGQAARALLACGADALASWGSAGALDPICVPGDLLLPAVVAAGPGQPWLAVDAVWQARLRRELQPHLTVRTGGLVQSPAVLGTSAAKRELHRRTGAMAVDMESAAVAEMAHTAGVPFVALRAVADNATTTLPRAALVALDQRGQLLAWRLLQALVRRPWEGTMLLKLGRDFAAARRTLRAVSRVAGPTLGRPPPTAV